MNLLVTENYPHVVLILNNFKTITEDNYNYLIGEECTTKDVTKFYA